jgi:PIN domain nuclease of toxin-antitoxin system
MNPILLDTHVAIWSVSGTLSTATARTIDAAAGRGDLLLSPITAWEIAMLVEKGRLSLAPAVQEYIRALFGHPGVVTATLTPAIAAAAACLPGKFHADPADRILVATAAAYGARLFTRDERIHEYAKATRHVRCVAC